MEITDVKVIPVDDEKLKAFVSIVFDHCFVVTDIKVIHGPKGLFVSMPSKKRKDGTFKDIAHPLNNQTRQYLEEKVLGVYRQQVSTDSTPASSSATETPEAPAPEAASTSAEPAEPADAAALAPESSQAEAPDAPQADSEATGKEGSEG
jgi:stage V sporulation protein G